MFFRSGVRVPFGTDAAVYPHGVNAREFAVYVGYGMSPLETIRTATTNASDLLGADGRRRQKVTVKPTPNARPEA